MNERYIVIGQNRDNPGYYAMWSNEGLIYSGKTPEEAVSSLLEDMYPGVWKQNDTVPMAEKVIKTEFGELGCCPKWVRRNGE